MMKMGHQMGVLCLLVALLGIVGVVHGRPNFIVFMADDLGYGDMGFMGNKDVDTPNIDALAWESVYFPNFYVAPVCAPTRASLLTGRYALRTGVWGVHGGRDYLNLDESTFANVLSDAGYATGMFGKWHNGKTDGYFSWDRGFHEACEVELYNYYDNIAQCNGKTVYTHGWTSHNIAHWAKDFMTRKTNEGKNFLLYVPFMAPHLGRYGGGWGEYWYSPKHIEQKYLNRGLSDGLAKMYGTVDMMDQTVGAILNHLDSLGKGSETVVMFFSDNGGTGKEKMYDWWRRNHLGLRGEKGQVSENGVRSPLFVRWRGSFPSGAKAHSQLASVEDIFPTMMELAGTGWGNKRVDGKSLVPVLYNPYEDQGFSGRTLFHTLMAPRWTYAWGVYKPLPNFGTDKSGLTMGREGEWAVREGRLKYVNRDGYEYLYDVVSDPGEHHHIWDWTTIKRLRDKTYNWWQSMVADGGSFTPPAFYIGYPYGGTGMILGNGVAQASNEWQIRTHDISGTVWGGQYLQYKVVVASAGGYHIKMHTANSFDGELEFKVKCYESETAVRGKIQWDGYVGWINIPQTGSSCVLTLSVVSGHGWLWFDHIWFQKQAPGGVHSG